MDHRHTRKEWAAALRRRWRTGQLIDRGGEEGVQDFFGHAFSVFHGYASCDITAIPNDNIPCPSLRTKLSPGKPIPNGPNTLKRPSFSTRRFLLILAPKRTCLRPLSACHTKTSEPTPKSPNPNHRRAHLATPLHKSIANLSSCHSSGSLSLLLSVLDIPDLCLRPLPEHMRSLISTLHSYLHTECCA